MNGKNQKIIKTVKNGGVGVLPTDTLYGLVGSAFSKKAVARIYRLKDRSQKKPLIILISSVDDLEPFGINLNAATEKILQKFWPGKVSVVLSCNKSGFFYLHRGTQSLAFRLPRKKSLIKILKKTGPLVAPSANPEGEEPAKNIREAKKYFESKIDFYVSGGTLDSEPSTLIEIKNKKIKILRLGAVGIKLDLIA